MSGATLSFPSHYNASEILYHNLDAGRGDKIAIYCEEATVTYGQLTALASRLGNVLKALGIPTGSRVLLMLLDTPHFPAAFFGAIRAGYLPIPSNTVLPVDNYEFFLRDSAAQAVIVSAALLPKLNEIRHNCPDLRHVIVSGGEPGAGNLSFDQLCAAASPDLDPAPTAPTDPAFWLYSSGSTGFPKGVVHLQKNIRYTIENYAKNLLNIQEHEVTFSASKAFHAYGLGNSLSFPYAVGASTVLFPGRPTPDAVFATIERFKPNLFYAVPTLYNALLANYKGSDMSSIRLCVSAAEALQPEICRQWKERFGLDILDGIGSTEMLHIFISNVAGQVKPGSSGRVAPGYAAKIVDEQGNPVAQGQTGDLLVSGGSAAALYWNRPDKTAHTMRGEWMFTGDRYYQDADGDFFYEGRSDDMFKVSGQWVSPIEVENTLMEHPAVFECAVILAKDEQGMSTTKAAIILNPTFTPDEALVKALQDHVKARIAPYKYPRIIHFMTELPKTVTGKIQRYKLRDA